MSSPLIVSLFFIERNISTWKKIKKRADIGFPYLAAVLSFKDLVVSPPKC